MSYDLYVVREHRAISSEDVRRALDRARRIHEGLSFFATDEEEVGGDAYFWRMPRARVALVQPPHADIDSSLPLVAIRAKHAQTPYAEFLAVVLAEELEADIFNPQVGEMLECLEYEDLDGLREKHDTFVREHDTWLEIEYWGSRETTSPQASHALLSAVVEAVAGAAETAFAEKIRFEISAEQVNWWHDFPRSSGRRVHAASYGGEAKRSIHVSGEASHRAEVDLFVGEIARRIGLPFREVVTLVAARPTNGRL